MNISPIPAFTDNYIWQINDGTTAFVVDPGDAKPVIGFLDDKGLKLGGIIITHHHWDHTGGIKALLEEWPGIPVFGPNNEAITKITHPLTDGEHITVFDTKFDVIEVPGHTMDHIAYYAAQPDGQDILFCGDTLFSSGCGRLFEGTPANMYDSLSKLRALPAETLVYCTHEYTQANLGFAKAVEPNNPDIDKRIADVNTLREQNTPSVPTTLGLELKINPFLRWDAPEVIEQASIQSDNKPTEPVEVFAAIRSWKDRF